MKMGLSMVVIGHVNFLLGALVHGVVLRHINLHKQARARDYAISNVIALTSGLVGIVVGILAIVLSKNKKRKGLTWALFAFALAAALMGAASAIGLFVSVVRTTIHGGRSLLTHCRFPDAIGYSSVTNECPFDPTRIYSTTLILWVPLIVTCVIQLVFCARCFAVCISFLGLPCCPNRKRTRDSNTATNARTLIEKTAAENTSHSKPRYTRTPRRDQSPPRLDTDIPLYQPRHPAPPPRASPQHRSLPPSERQPLRQPYSERPQRLMQETNDSVQMAPEHHQLLQRGAMERSSFWI